MRSVLKKLRLTEEVRGKVKVPLGRLITGSPDKAMLTLKNIIEREKPIKVFAVGDFVSLNMIEHGITANLLIIDNKIMRQPTKNTSIKGRTSISSYNPPGMITPEAWEAVKKCIEDPTITTLVIDGEEDLLTLPVIKMAPIGALVVYGQPNMGLVIVRVTEKKRKEIEHLINKMEILDEA